MKVNKVAGGSISKENINELLNLFPTIKVKEVSALTNYNITEVFQQLVKELDSDPALKMPTKEYFEKIQNKLKGGKQVQQNEDGDDQEEEKGVGIVKDDSSTQREGGFFGCCGARGTGGGLGDSEDSDENA